MASCVTIARRALPEEMRATFRELKAFAREDLQAAYMVDLALCFDFSSDWAPGIQLGQPKLKYIPECTSWYTAAGPHAGINIVDCTGDLGAYRAVLAPAMYVVSAAHAERIGTFVEGGRHVYRGSAAWRQNRVEPNHPYAAARLAARGDGCRSTRPPTDLLRKTRCTFFRRSCRRPSKRGREVSYLGGRS